jgi:hypothetical protein
MCQRYHRNFVRVDRLRPARTHLRVGAATVRIPTRLVDGLNEPRLGKLSCRDTPRPRRPLISILHNSMRTHKLSHARIKGKIHSKGSICQAVSQSFLAATCLGNRW